MSNQVATPMGREPLRVPLSLRRGQLHFHWQVCVCVRTLSLRMTVVPNVRDSTAARSFAEGGVHSAAFPGYICKGRSYTYFLLQIKENMLKLRLCVVVLFQPIPWHTLRFYNVWEEERFLFKDSSWLLRKFIKMQFTIFLLFMCVCYFRMNSND